MMAKDELPSEVVEAYNSLNGRDKVTRYVNNLLVPTGKGMYSLNLEASVVKEQHEYVETKKAKETTHGTPRSLVIARDFHHNEEPHNL